MLLRVEAENTCQALDSIGIREPPHTSLQIADRAHTHARPFRELFLGQTCRRPVATQQDREALLLIHVSVPPERVVSVTLTDSSRQHSTETDAIKISRPGNCRLMRQQVCWSVC